MSAYMCFFLRGKDDHFYPLGSYSRSTAIYEIFDEARYSNWESISAITFKDIETVRKENFNNIIGWKKLIKETENKIELIKSIEAPLDEKVDVIDRYSAELNGFKDKVDELVEVSSFCDFLETILEDIKYGDYGSIDVDNYIYVGIEIGHPTVEDIICD